MSLPLTAWAKLNCLQTGVRQFNLSMHKWSVPPLPNCKCHAFEQTAHHILIACPIHQAPYRAQGFKILDDKTEYWLQQHLCQHLIWAEQQPGAVNEKLSGPSPVCL